MSTFLRIAVKLAFLVMVFGVVLFGFAYIYFFKSTLNALPYEQPKLVRVHRGMRYRQIVDELHKQGIIKYKEPLYIVGYAFRKEAENIKPGRYYIPSQMTNVGLIQFMHSREQDEVRVLIPDGLQGREVAGVINEYLDIDSLDFMKAFTDTVLLRELGIPAPNAEGYLLPDTYNIPWESTARDVLKFFVKEFRKLYNDSLQAIATRAGLTESEVITLASIVQSETPVKSERPLIAGVYLNRLRKGMKLQADPTVEYALGGEHRRLFLRDLKFDSPYNTYMYEGLPPGPINNPSRDAILAALHPEPTPYLFFVATGTGGHRFSETAEGHLDNVAVYREFMKIKRAADDSAKAAGGG